MLGVRVRVMAKVRVTLGLKLGFATAPAFVRNRTNQSMRAERKTERSGPKVIFERSER